MLMAKPELWGFSPFLASFLLTGAVFIIVSLVTPKPTEEITETFFGIE